MQAFIPLQAKDNTQCYMRFLPPECLHQILSYVRYQTDLQQVCKGFKFIVSKIIQSELASFNEYVSKVERVANATGEHLLSTDLSTAHIITRGARSLSSSFSVDTAFFADPSRYEIIEEDTEELDATTILTQSKAFKEVRDTTSNETIYKISSKANMRFYSDERIGVISVLVLMDQAIFRHLRSGVEVAVPFPKVFQLLPFETFILVQKIEKPLKTAFMHVENGRVIRRSFHVMEKVTSKIELPT